MAEHTTVRSVESREGTPTPHVGTLADVMALVQVTPSQGIALLNSLAESNSDRDPALSASINQAINQLASMPPSEEPATKPA